MRGQSRSARIFLEETVSYLVRFLKRGITANQAFFHSLSRKLAKVRNTVFGEDTWAQISKIKLPGGLVNKGCYVLIFAEVALLGIACTARTELIAGMALLLAAGVPVLGLYLLIKFAERNPQVAIYEGAEFWQHELLQASKNNPRIISKLENLIEAHPLDPSENRERLMQPDEVLEQQSDTLLEEKKESDE